MPFSRSSHTGEMLRRYSTIPGTTSMMWSISSMVLYSPMESLSEPWATSWGRPMASRTWLGSREPEVQAEPDDACLKMAEHTLTQMYRGGLFDHIGYGFCRYSTDVRFLVPHFGKMLYDNAMLIMA